MIPPTPEAALTLARRFVQENPMTAKAWGLDTCINQLAALAASPEPRETPADHERIAKQMFVAGINVARSYGNNAFHLHGDQLERQFRKAFEGVQPPAPEAETPAAFVGPNRKETQ